MFYGNDIQNNPQVEISENSIKDSLFKEEKEKLDEIKKFFQASFECIEKEYSSQWQDIQKWYRDVILDLKTIEPDMKELEKYKRLGDIDIFESWQKHFQDANNLILDFNSKEVTEIFKPVGEIYKTTREIFEDFKLILDVIDYERKQHIKNIPKLKERIDELSDDFKRPFKEDYDRLLKRCNEELEVIENFYNQKRSYVERTFEFKFHRYLKSFFGAVPNLKSLFFPLKGDEKAGIIIKRIGDDVDSQIRCYLYDEDQKIPRDSLVKNKKGIELRENAQQIYNFFKTDEGLSKILYFDVENDRFSEMQIDFDAQCAMFEMKDILG